MVLAHREELIFQAKDKIHTVTGLEVQVEMGAYRSQHGLFGAAPVIVSTVQTHTAGNDGGGRMTKFEPEDFGLLIIDEAHHATAGSYKRCIEWYKRNPELKILGVTATPDRSDEQALGQIFDTVAYDYEVMDAIQGG
jgi:superfamily II DNA or RNA helicase